VTLAFHVSEPSWATLPLVARVSRLPVNFDRESVVVRAGSLECGPKGPPEAAPAEQGPKFCQHTGLRGRRELPGAIGPQTDAR